MFDSSSVTYPAAVPWEACVVAIGNFDGVHEGHRALLEAARAQAGVLDLPLVVLTFEPHPRAVLRPDVPFSRLMTAEEKVAALRAAGAGHVAVLPFDLTVAGWDETQFRDVLVGWLRAAFVVVGENFKYGHKARGDVASLVVDGRFDVLPVPLVVCEAGVVVSSSRLREGL